MHSQEVAVPSKYIALVMTPDLVVPVLQRLWACGLDCVSCVLGFDASGGLRGEDDEKFEIPGPWIDS